MKKVILLLLASFALAGCVARIPTGSVGIKQSIAGNISRHTVGQGLYSAFFTTYIPIDTTLTRAAVKDLQPKDAHGVALQDVSLVMTYKLNPKLVGIFYQHSKELDREPGTAYNTLGLEILEQSVIPYAVQIATERSNLESIANDLEHYSNAIAAVANKRLHKLYPGIDPFIIQSVTIQTFRLPAAIQKQMNAKEGYRAELQTLAEKMEVVQKLKAIKVAQASINADALASAAKASGLTPNELIAWKRARALQALAKTGSAKVLIGTR